LKNSQYEEKKGLQKEKEPDLGHNTLPFRTTATREVHLDGRKAAESSTDSGDLLAVLLAELSVLLSVKNIHKQQCSEAQ